MDFLDGLDLETAHKKSHRVRSWYLYETLKSLERSQIDAARRLKYKSHQDKILHQELHERRARRRLCDQFESCQSESHLASREVTIPKTPSVKDIFVNFCDLEAEYDGLDSDIYNFGHCLETRKIYDYLADNKPDGNSDAINSIDDDEHLNNAKQELKIVKDNIAKNINLQLETVKDNIDIEKYTKLCDDCKISDIDSFDSCELSIKDIILKDDKYYIDEDSSISMIWSKLVTFSYEIMKLNHGANCYFDYSSQFLTAVLVFDVLRRVVSRMSVEAEAWPCSPMISSFLDSYGTQFSCYGIIPNDFNRFYFTSNPYVSPIKYNCIEIDVCKPCYNKSRKKVVRCVKRKDNTDCARVFNNRTRPNNRALLKKGKQKSKIQCRCRNSFSKSKLCERRQRRCSSAKLTISENDVAQTGEHSNRKIECKCRCIKKLFDSMLKVSRLIDDILYEIND